MEPVCIPNPRRWFFLSPLGWMDKCASWGGSSSMESETYTVWGRVEKKNAKLRLFKYRALEGPSLALWQVFLWFQWWWQRWVLTHCTYMPGTHSKRFSYINPHDNLRHTVPEIQRGHTWDDVAGMWSCWERGSVDEQTANRELHLPQRCPLFRGTWNTSLSLLWMSFTSPVKQEYWCQLWAPHFVVLRSGDSVWKCFVKSKMLGNSFSFQLTIIGEAWKYKFCWLLLHF